jgi:hypothetical protein
MTTIILVFLAFLALIALLAMIKTDGYGTRPGPRSHHDDLDPWSRQIR